MAGTRINGRDMVLLIDAVDRSEETTLIALNFGTRQTFADMRGRIPKRLDMTIAQELTAGSLYRLATGEDNTPVTGMFKPLGNATPSLEQPHFSFNATPSGPSGDTFMGGEAAEDPSQALTAEVQWLITDWTEITA